MLTCALTGGIATGKSTVCRIFLEECPGVRIFDSDACVRGLLEENSEVASSLRERFGEAAVLAGGRADRAFLRQCVFRDVQARRDLEAILHPRVREDCLASRAQSAKEGAALFVADIPLLFEKNFDFGQDRSLISATSRSTQVLRLKARNGHDTSMVEAILAAQLPLEEKLRRADVVFWNEGPQEVLRRQIRRFLLSIP